MVDNVTIGQCSNADGTQPGLRGGRQGDLIVSHLHGHLYENVSRGNVFALNLTATTTGVAAGNINLAAAAASTQFAVWNPITSGMNLSLLAVYYGITSGTTVGGPLFHSYFGTTLPTIASTGTAVNCLLGNTSGSAAKYVASAGGVTLTAGSALLTLRPSTIGFSAGTYASLAGSTQFEFIDGAIVIGPGAGWVPTFAAAGTSVLSTYGAVWEEVPV
jgi:hypothetical protein